MRRASNDWMDFIANPLRPQDLERPLALEQRLIALLATHEDEPGHLCASGLATRRFISQIRSPFKCSDEGWGILHLTTISNRVTNLNSPGIDNLVAGQDSQ